MRNNNKGFVVSAVLYPLLVLFLALIMGLLSMSDTRKRILDKMKLEISDSIFDEATCSCDTILNKLNYLIKNGVSGGGGGGGSYTQNVLGLDVKPYADPAGLPNVGNDIGDIAAITDVEISSYYVSSVAPNTPAPGMIWIMSDVHSEYYIMSDYSRIGISYAMQYICDENEKNCNWTLIKAYVFNDAKWELLYYVDLTESLYYEGDEYVYNFDYTGKYQTFYAPFSGTYEVELYGAAGGLYDAKNTNYSTRIGAGAYTKGQIYLDAGTPLYIYVGGQGGTGYYDTTAEGKSSTGYISSGGWNGGGYGTYHATNYWGNGGGGATDIRTVATETETSWNDFSSLKSRIMVAAGGSGTAYYSNTYGRGAAGGTLKGDFGHIDNTNYEYPNGSQGGTQSKGGRKVEHITDSNYTSEAGGFGYGGHAAYYHNSGGGGGYYGGSGGGYTHAGSNMTGGGGSSYISGYNGCDSVDEESTADNIIHTGSAYHYSGKFFTDAIMEAGKNTGNGSAKITLKTVQVRLPEEVKQEQDDSETTWTYEYSGDYQVFTAPATGTYNIELWGASGGSYDQNNKTFGGAGGYTSGEIYLTKGKQLYVYVGGAGGSWHYNANGWKTGDTTYYSTGGWNGGGNAAHHSNTYYGLGGGGATDVRLVSGDALAFDSLKSRIMVAGGGGGASEYNDTMFYGGAGGGLNGENGHMSNVQITFTNAENGGTQVKGGIAPKSIFNDVNHYGEDGKFGIGGKSAYWHSSGGGGGYYGGGGGSYNRSDGWITGGGGSSYISGYDGCSSITEDSTVDNIKTNGSSVHYSGLYFTNTIMKQGENRDDGRAVITLVNKEELSSSVVNENRNNQNKVFSFGYTGDYQVFTAPKSGIYKIDAYGASGGYHHYSWENIAGKGAKTTGSIYLDENDKLYIYVGGHGGDIQANAKGSDIDGETSYYSTGGYNGGGIGKYTNDNHFGAGGGGATDIRLVAGAPDSFESLKSRIMVAAGGGGIAYIASVQYKAGNGGTLTGVSGKINTNDTTFLNVAEGGTQTKAGLGAKHFTNVNHSGKDAVFATGGEGAYYYGAGGGGGYYAGGGGGHNYVDGYVSAAGGSSYISGHIGCNSITKDSKVDDIDHTGSAFHYSGNYFTGTSMQEGVNLGHGKVQITFEQSVSKTVEQLQTEIRNSDTEWNYTYSGDYQIFTAPTSGTYKIETWGASGGYFRQSWNSVAGRGAYATGNIYLDAGTKLYVYVGGHGGYSYADRNDGSGYSVYYSKGGYNGGGDGTYYDNSYFGGGGGGATDIRLVSGETNDFDSLKSRIMVAAGGGGVANVNAQYYAANGGALVGEDGKYTTGQTKYFGSTGATQSKGGIAAARADSVQYTGEDGTFGIGGNASYYHNSGGGGGYYGGAGGGRNANNEFSTASGGSSYISGYAGCNSITNDSTKDNIVHTGSAYHYSGKYFTGSSMIAGENLDHGKARITFVKQENKTEEQLAVVQKNNDKVWEYAYSGTYQTFTAPVSGTYKMEAWGASGGYHHYSWSTMAAKGAYTSGSIYLDEGTKLYIYVGGQGGQSYYNKTGWSGYNTYYSTGGWNGGGNGTYYDSNYFGNGGGGATDIRTVPTETLTTWDDFDSLKSRIMVAAGGGGISQYRSGDANYQNRAGHGGALVGLFGKNVNNPYDYTNGAKGGSQTSPGKGAFRLDITNHNGEDGKFGSGGDGAYYYSGGGGGGYYGGGGGGHNYNVWVAGAGGSSYISGYDGCNSINSSSTENKIIHTGSKYHYTGYYFVGGEMKEGENLNNGKARITLEKAETKTQAQLKQEKLEYEKEWNFTYSGDYQEFTAPQNGTYQITLNGAEGGHHSHDHELYAGNGAKTTGNIYLKAGTKLYVYVGSQGGMHYFDATGNDGASTYYSKGGYNGGGIGTYESTSYWGNGGGGATDIRLVSGEASDFDSLKSRIMVAGGGAGASYTSYYNYGGNGGGLVGGRGKYKAETTEYMNMAYGGSQTSGGKATFRADAVNWIGKDGLFGLGGDGSSSPAGGGGGGYYGGGGGGHNYNVYTTGGGGSSYISGYTGCNSIAEASTATSIVHTGDKYHYSGYYFTGSSMEEGVNVGNGSANIKLISTSSSEPTEEVNDDVFEFTYSGKYQTFTAPQTGYYDVQLWGASGGYYHHTWTAQAGTGSYTSGRIYLTKGTQLYVYVGGEGGQHYFTNTGWQGYNTYYSKGGWNGGGEGTYYDTSYFGAGGGGATDIRTVPTSASEEWNETESLKSRIMVAAGGSGVQYVAASYYGAAGGGLTGYAGRFKAELNVYTNGATGGTQIKGGAPSDNLTEYGTGSHTGAAGSFGLGGTGSYYYSSGGGSGWYGGGGGGHASGKGYISAASGSSYISGHAGCIAVTSAGSPKVETYSKIEDSMSFTNYKFTNTVMIDGLGYQWTTQKSESVVKMPSHDGLDTMTGNLGNGYAKITYMGV